jgi:hypothetical protein
MENCAKTLRFLLRSRQLERDTKAFDGFLGSADPLGHSPFRNAKRVGDLRAGQAAHRPQCECNSGGRSQGGMAAHERKFQGVVFSGRRLDFELLLLVVARIRGRLVFATTTGEFTTNLIDHSPGCSSMVNEISALLPLAEHRAKKTLTSAVFAATFCRNEESMSSIV